MRKKFEEAYEFDFKKAEKLKRCLNSKLTYIILRKENEHLVNKLYNSYKISASAKDNSAETEFLYIPSEQEVANVFDGTDAVYVGAITDDNELLGIAKIKKMKKFDEFFVRPDYETSSKDCFGISGLLVSEKARGKKVGTFLMATSVRLLNRMGAAGVYADCDYRNVASFKTLSAHLDFAGYTDGRNGAEGEQSIYVTFYKSFENPSSKSKEDFVWCFSKDDRENSKNYFSKDEAVDILDNKLNQFGLYTESIIPYGDGYNKIKMLKSATNTTKIKTIDKSRVIDYDKIFVKNDISQEVINSRNDVIKLVDDIRNVSNNNLGVIFKLLRENQRMAGK